LEKLTLVLAGKTWQSSLTISAAALVQITKLHKLHSLCLAGGDIVLEPTDPSFERPEPFQSSSGMLHLLQSFALAAQTSLSPFSSSSSLTNLNLEKVPRHQMNLPELALRLLDTPLRSVRKLGIRCYSGNDFKSIAQLFPHCEQLTVNGGVKVVQGIEWKIRKHTRAVWKQYLIKEAATVQDVNSFLNFLPSLLVADLFFFLLPNSESSKFCDAFAELIWCASVIDAQQKDESDKDEQVAEPTSETGESSDSEESSTYDSEEYSASDYSNDSDESHNEGKARQMQESSDLDIDNNSSSSEGDKAASEEDAVLEEKFNLESSVQTVAIKLHNRNTIQSVRSRLAGLGH
jgi:hypothetical protein